MTNFAIDALQQLRENAVQQIIEYNRKVEDIDAALEKLAGSPGEMTSLRVYLPPLPVTRFPVKAPEEANAATEAPPAPVEPPAPAVAPPSDADWSPFPEPGAPEAPVADEQQPWDVQAEQDAAAVQAPAEPSKPTSGRRTNEQIAADHGVTLDDVKAWLGPDGGRVTAGKIKEFAELHPAAAAAPQEPAAVAAPSSRPAEPTADFVDVADTVPAVDESDWAPF